jgi:hypothetical protein
MASFFLSFLLIFECYSLNSLTQNAGGGHQQTKKRMLGIYSKHTQKKGSSDESREKECRGEFRSFERFKRKEEGHVWDKIP